MAVYQSATECTAQLPPEIGADLSHQVHQQKGKV